MIYSNVKPINSSVGHSIKLHLSHNNDIFQLNNIQHN